jgi:malonyl-CoA/methylmalonyl-CoA synthetase
VRLVDPDGRPVADGDPGEIEVRGPGVFAEYWRRPAEAAAAVRADPAGGAPWFRTGDEAVVDQPSGVYRIRGRQSVDILKSGGYKLSALEIEPVLAGHPAVAECAVVGVPDPEWGQRVGVAVVPVPGSEPPSLEALREWAGERLARYKLPTRLVALEGLPRNALGKVVKPELAARFAPAAPDEPAGGG